MIEEIAQARARDCSAWPGVCT